MIRLIRIDGVEILLNEDMIQSIEASPDTTITLAGGEEIKVKNSVSDITEKITAAGAKYSVAPERENLPKDE